MTCSDCLPLKIENERLKVEIQTLRTPPVPIMPPMQVAGPGFRRTGWLEIDHLQANRKE